MQCWVRVFVCLFSVLISVFASAAVMDPKQPEPEGCVDCFNFVAPSVIDAGSMSSPQVGLIVFDTADGEFKGYDNSGNWNKLSNANPINPAAGTSSVTLNSSDKRIQVFNPTSAELTVTLGVTFTAGSIVTVVNNGTKQIKVQSSTGTDDIAPVYPGASLQFLANVDLADVGAEWNVMGTIASGWESYTPTFQGFGAPTLVDFRWRRQGPDMLIEGRFRSGTSSSTEAQVGLPNSHTIHGSYMSQGSPGVYFRFATAVDKGGNMNAQPGDGFLNFAGVSIFGSNASNPGDLINGNGVAVVNETIYLKARVPIQGWETNRGI